MFGAWKYFAVATAAGFSDSGIHASFGAAR